MIIISLSNSDSLAKSLARKLKAEYSKLTIDKFPDEDLYLKYNADLKNQTVVLINSFQPHPNWALYTAIFAAETAKDLGARKVILVAPYLAFMRQDKRFKPGEAISTKIMAKLLNQFIDELITIDAHLHRYKAFKTIFKIPSHNLTANDLIANYIKKKIKRPVLVGPDRESSQWAERIAEQIMAESIILEKKRLSPRIVKVKTNKPVSLHHRNVVIVDDIISTGSTMAETAQLIKKLGAKTVTAIAVHGLFVENAYQKLKKAGINKIITTNTINHRSNNIDVISLLVNELRKSS